MLRSTLRSVLILCFLVGACTTQQSTSGSSVLQYDLSKFFLDQPPAINLGSPSFDRDNAAYLRDDDKLVVIKAGRAATSDFGAAARQAIDRDIFGATGAWDGSWDTSTLEDNSLYFDQNNRIYTLVIPRYSNLETAALLWSDTLGKDWKAVALSAANATMERPDAFNTLNGPPTIISYDYYGRDSGPNLWLERLTQTASGDIAVGQPALVSDQSLLVSNHSGGGNSSYTVGDRVFITYPVLDKNGAGTAAYIRQFNKSTNEFDGPPVALGRSTTKETADPHDIPVITGDKAGTLHVVVGAHHAMFTYSTSKTPLSIYDGWSDPVLLGEPKRADQFGSYTYASINMTTDENINILARMEGDEYRFALAQIRKPAKGAQVRWNGSLNHRVIARPNRKFYGVWRHRVTQDREGKLYLNIRYWPNQLTPEEAVILGLDARSGINCRIGRCWYPDAPYIQPTTLISSDGGLTWVSQNPNL